MSGEAVRACRVVWREVQRLWRVQRRDADDASGEVDEEDRIEEEEAARRGRELEAEGLDPFTREKRRLS